MPPNSIDLLVKFGSNFSRRKSHVWDCIKLPNFNYVCCSKTFSRTISKNCPCQLVFNVILVSVVTSDFICNQSYDKSEKARL